MKLRWKIFIVLLIASLIPMAVVTLFSQRASNKLAQSISAQTQEVLSETVRREIISATKNYALITKGAKSSIEFALQLLIFEAEKALSLPLPEPEHIYFAKDFSSPATAPEDLLPSSTHMKVLADGRLVAKRISNSYPSFFLPKTVDPDKVSDDISRLNRLAPKLKEITEILNPGVFWIYASLENGVHISFPGHGGYAKDYDPRLRPWFISARNCSGLCWGSPVTDATTGQIVFTVSAPFTRPDGSFAGVAAIDVLIPNVLLESEISAQWSKNMHSFLVNASEEPTEEGEKSWVLSQDNKNGLKKEGNGTTGIFFLDNDPDFSKLSRYLSQGKVGSIEMDYRGVDSFWAFAEIYHGLFFVITAPKSLVMELPEEVGQSFLGYIQGQRTISLAAAAVALVVVAGLALYFSRSNTKSIMSIVDGLKKLEQGDFSVRLSANFHDERDLIVTTFNQIIPKLEDHLRMSSTLGVAKEVQQSLLPATNPTHPGFDIAGTSLYCEETGGDYYDFIRINDKKLAVMVGDVSGHGVSSALLMASARALIMQRTSMPGSASDIISDVNTLLSHDTSLTGNFMTFFYCELEVLSQQFTWVRAGHDPAIRYNPENGLFDEFKGKGLPLGIDETFAYEQSQQTLAPGQIILIGTDGIWEMCNEREEMFGKQRLKEIIRTHCSKTAAELLDIIILALDDFSGSRQRDDDITMVVVKVRP